MIDYDDRTEAEQEMRDILSPEGKVAIAECENRRGEVRRRVAGEAGPAKS
ncbi:MAG TPA: hypothetical protein VFS67_29715 [Polyangiaceae bacterium]|nr:hypothetical protein [Polyangiaceae bacterium]